MDTNQPVEGIFNMTKLIEQLCTQGFREAVYGGNTYHTKVLPKSGILLEFSNDGRFLTVFTSVHDASPTYDTKLHPQKVADVLYVHGIKPFFSSGICALPTAGYGELTEFGYWEFPLYVDPDTLKIVRAEDFE